MKTQNTVTPETVALEATFRLHKELLNDWSFAGYEGTKECIDRLFQELFVIARDEVSLEVEPVDQVVETFYQYQIEIGDGGRDVCWYL